MINKNLFIVHTDYHLYLSLIIISENYAGEEYFNYICIVRDSVNRFNYLKEINGNIDIKVFDIFERKYKKQPAFFAALEYGKIANPSQLIIFNQHDLFAVYIAEDMFERKVNVSLAPDGAKMYFKSQKSGLVWRIRTYLRWQVFLFIHQKLKPNLRVPSLNYADMSSIKYVWTHFPESYINWNNKTLLKINNSNLKENQLINSYFDFTLPVELSKDIIFFLNQPHSDINIQNKEIEILKTLLINFPDLKMVVKVHPSCSKSQREKFLQLEKLILIEDTRPAELYIKNISESLIISFWSTSCFENNKSNKSFWLYPVLVRQGLMPNNFNLKPPSQHLTLIDDILEIN